MGRAARELLELGRRLAREDSGQAVTEYILLLSVILTAVIALLKGVLAALDKFTLAFGAQLEKDLKAGRANPTDVWGN